MLKFSIIQLYFLSGLIMVLIDIYINTKAFNSFIYIKYQRFLNLKFKDMFIILFIPFFIVISILQYFNVLEILGSHYSIFDLMNCMSESSNSNNEPSSNNASVPTINNSGDISATVSPGALQNSGDTHIHSPNFNVKISDRAVNGITATASTTGGASLAFRVVKSMPNATAPAKIGAALGIMATTPLHKVLSGQVTTLAMRAVLNKQDSDSKSNSSNTNKLLSFITTNNSNDDSNKNSNSSLNVPYILSKYPFNLMKHIDNMLNVMISLMFLLFNIFFSGLIGKLNLHTYLPDNKLGILLTKMLDRYIKLGLNVSIYLYVIIFICIAILLIVLKICVIEILY